MLNVQPNAIFYTNNNNNKKTLSLNPHVQVKTLRIPYACKLLFQELQVLATCNRATRTTCNCATRTTCNRSTRTTCNRATRTTCYCYFSTRTTCNCATYPSPDSCSR